MLLLMVWIGGAVVVREGCSSAVLVLFRRGGLLLEMGHVRIGSRWGVTAAVLLLDVATWLRLVVVVGTGHVTCCARRLTDRGVRGVLMGYLEVLSIFKIWLFHGVELVLLACLRVDREGWIRSHVLYSIHIEGRWVMTQVADRVPMMPRSVVVTWGAVVWLRAIRVVVDVLGHVVCNLGLGQVGNRRERERT